MADPFNRPATFAAGAEIIASQHNDNWDAIEDYLNARLGAATEGQIWVANASGQAVPQSLVTLRQPNGLIVPSGNLSLTDSYVDLTGASAVVTASVNAYALITAAFNFQASIDFAPFTSFGNVTNGAIGTINVAGADQPETASYLHVWVVGSQSGVTEAYADFTSFEGTVTQVYRISLAAGVPTTIKLRAKRASSSVDGLCVASGTRALYHLIAQ